MTKNCRKKIKLPSQQQKTKVCNELNDFVHSLSALKMREEGRSCQGKLLNPDLGDLAVFETEDRLVKTRPIHRVLNAQTFIGPAGIHQLPSRTFTGRISR